MMRISGGASQPLLVGHKCVTGEAQAIKLGHTYINEVGHTEIQVGHRPHPRAASDEDKAEAINLISI